MAGGGMKIKRVSFHSNTSGNNLLLQVKRFRLSREAKNKAEKNRSKVAEAFWKSIHAAKAERAQEERERKRREIKERIKEIEDPDRQRKLEERELRRERKKAAPKMKQLKVKAMQMGK